MSFVTPADCAAIKAKTKNKYVRQNAVPARLQPKFSELKKELAWKNISRSATELFTRPAADNPPIILVDGKCYRRITRR